MREEDGLSRTDPSWLQTANEAQRPLDREGARISGVSWDLRAFHVDPIMGEGRHEHVWTVTAWWPASPWRDGRALRHALSVVLNGLAPETEAFQRELPPELWSGEAIAEAVLAILTPPPVRVDVDRPGFHVRLSA